MQITHMIQFMQILNDTYSFYPEPEYGSTLSVLVNGVSHPGIYVGGGFVIDNSSKRGGVFRVTIETFRDGRELRNHGLIGGLSADQIVQNAYAALGKDYDFFLFNCKDFVREARGQELLTLLIKAGVTGAVAYAGFRVARRA